MYNVSLKKVIFAMEGGRGSKTEALDGGGSDGCKTLI
jgi:hypothetical protein